MLRGCVKFRKIAHEHSRRAFCATCRIAAHGRKRIAASQNAFSALSTQRECHTLWYSSGPD